MYKLILFILLCMWSIGSDAHKRGLQNSSIAARNGAIPEGVDVLNPFIPFNY